MTTPTKPPEFICPEGFQVCMSGNREYLAAELCGHLDDGEYFLIRRKHVEHDGRVGIVFDPEAHRRIDLLQQQIEELKAGAIFANDWSVKAESALDKIHNRLTALESKPRQASEGNAVEKAIKATIAAFAAFDAGNMNLDELQDCIIGRIRKVEPAK